MGIPDTVCVAALVKRGAVTRVGDVSGWIDGQVALRTGFYVRAKVYSIRQRSGFLG